MIKMKKEDKQNSEKKDENAAKPDSKEVKLPEAKEKSKDNSIADLTESLQRLQAEFENYKKRVEKENREFVKYANAGLISKILNTIDTFEIALRNLNEHEKFVKGIEMIYAQLISTLESEGLRPINSVGKKFDPSFMECVEAVEDKRSDYVVREVKPGYTIFDKIIRVAQVIVGKKRNL